MKKNWYLVAHRAGARVFEQSGIASSLSVVSSFDNPEGRMRERELASDRGGKTPQTMGTGFNQYAQEHSKTEHVTDQFVKLLVSDLSVHARAQKFDYLVLVAEPQLLGKLREHLDKALASKVRTTLAKDLGGVPDSEIVVRLSEVLFTREAVA